ncbi:MAG TPA: ATP synthase F0 subunit A [Bacteroidales bacterium]|nr:MAG: ATP synthase F0 subunit A [Bacteroidetes bacterium GWF2_33_38]OFY73472.1 MAG: ATP synthase F0 subunit A [Bacteroidetes bacterium RIFOXYA12_FULL_33_9]OFY89087.1 MAG: ATP synthase F0 subunit A [Bacteroidetes bacterium RIFOXYA2_FULL_33_7]HBF88855.1 ATP synthase F0 subunit A [Bacteroidales bacterium]
MIKLQFLSAVLLFLFSVSAVSASEEIKEEKSTNDIIFEHISDSHYWHILDYTDDSGVEHPIAFPLPVILVANGQFDVFMSSEFHHGHQKVTKGKNTYQLYHDKVYIVEDTAKIQHVVVESDTLTKAIAKSEHEIDVAPTNMVLLDFSITKNVASLFLSALLLLLIFIPVAKAYKKTTNSAPKGLQSFMEPIILFVRDDIAVPNIGKHKYQKYLPYLLTVFFFIWINNMMGLIPFFPGGANVTGNIAVTFILATSTLLVTNFSGNKNYWKHIFAMPGLPFWLLPIMIIVELIGIIAKPFALMIRLFANITAGHIIVLSLLSLIFIFKSIYIAPASVAFVLFMDILELFVAALQAYIFTMLSALFIGLAVQEHH